MRQPGSFTMLRTLIRADNAPSYIRLYRRFRQRGSGRHSATPAASRFTTAFYWALAILWMLLCCALMPGAYMLWFTIIWGDDTSVAWLASGVALLIGGAGLAEVALGIYRAVSHERSRHTWDDLLLLPYERSMVVLHSLAHGYAPLISMLGGVMALMAAVLTTLPSAWKVPALLGLMVVEWGQLQALGLSLGMATASARQRDIGVLLPILTGLAVIVLRGGVGWLVAELSGLPIRVMPASILVGPLIRVAAPGSILITVGVVIVYLLALEVLIRRLFMWCMARVGE